MSSSPASRARKSERLLLFLFLLSVPFLNPWIRGDGVGYYAFARALLIEHNFDFRKDYQFANSSFRLPRLDQYGQPKFGFRTPTGRLDNHFTIGPAILWSPFLIVTHAGVLLLGAAGFSVAADGFSAPYRMAMALATAFYGFLGLLLSFRLARQYVGERWALLATIAVWWASSVPVYMYFNPSWSHAHSAFAVALFLWYWHETRFSRSIPQWLLLAAMAALMVNVYYANAMVLVVLAVEAFGQYFAVFRSDSPDGPSHPRLPDLFLGHFLFVFVFLIGLLPTFITRLLIYGSPFESGYIPLRNWLWSSPQFLAVLFSPNHGLVSWTPLLGLAILGLFIFCRREPRVGAPLLAAFLAFYLFIACYPDWAGISSYGNRFFVSLTSLFILGLAVFLDRVAALFRSRRAALAAASTVLMLFVLWNAGLMFQWGAHLVPARGPISFAAMIHNQFFVVPRRLSRGLTDYFFRRKVLMQQIEEQDLQELEQNSPRP